MKKKIWVLFLVLSIMTVTTVCYVSMVHNAKTSYANGKFVYREVPEDEIGYCLSEAESKQSDY